jgi:branched-subunit amino acid transport protein
MITILLTIAAVSYVLKVIPLVLHSRPQGSPILARSIDYAVCVIMGEIIMRSATGEKPLGTFLGSLNTYDIAALGGVIVAYTICRVKGSVVMGLIAGLGTFSLLIGCIK